MKTRRIGSLEVSVAGLGCNNFGMRIDAEETKKVVDAAIDSGITLFDTADMYGGTKSEEFLGQALGPFRSEVAIATKFGMKIDDQRQGAHPDYVKLAVEDSLRRLCTDHIDLYQLHTPDPTVPIGDTLAALDGLVRQGKVIEIGCSNFSVQQLQEAAEVAGDRAHFVSVQNEYSLLHRDPESGVLDECRSAGLAFLPYFPLASGLLTGKYRRGEKAPEGTRMTHAWAAKGMTEANMEIVERLQQFAASRGHTILELAFSWLLSHDVVASVIAGATSPEQVRANVAATAWELTADELAEIDRIVPPASGKEQ